MWCHLLSAFGKISLCYFRIWQKKFKRITFSGDCNTRLNIEDHYGHRLDLYTDSVPVLNGIHNNVNVTSGSGVIVDVT